MVDLIVVVVGPGGSSAARRVSELGLDTLLAEKQRFPRYKACGAPSRSKRCPIWVSSSPHLAEATILAARVHFESRSIEARSEHPLTLMVSRSAFDTFLLERARESGATAYMGEKVGGLVLRLPRYVLHS